MSKQFLLAAAAALVLFPSAASAKWRPGGGTKGRVVKGTRVEMKTTQGTILIRLFPKKAPKTVANFLNYVSAGHYNGTIFHRVIANFMVQGGGFTKGLAKRATRAPIMNEADNGLSNARGTLAMARTSNPHSASAQFFINLVNNTYLDHKSKSVRGWGYCVFGKVIKGMGVVDKIARLPKSPVGRFRNMPSPMVRILSSRVLP